MPVPSLRESLLSTTAASASRRGRHDCRDYGRYCRNRPATVPSNERRGRFPRDIGRGQSKGNAAIAADDDESKLKHDVTIRLWILARLLRSDFDRQLSGAAITRSQLDMVAVVHGHPGATQRTIAEILEMSEASAGRLIDRLCTDGLLERRARDGDRRARAVYVTEAALPLLVRASEIARTNADRIFQGLDRQDLQRLGQALEVISENVARNMPWVRRMSREAEG